MVETGSIVGASLRLHLTQPGVSRRIQSLEERARCRPARQAVEALEADSGGPRNLCARATDAGRVDDLKTGLSPKGVVRGEFRLGISPYLSEVGITTLADRLRSSFPDMMLRITAGWPEQLLEQLRRSEIDVAAFCLPDGMHPPTEIEADALDIQPLHVAAAPSLDLPSPATLQDLSSLPWIINQDGCGFRSAIQRRFEQEHLPLRIGIEALSSDLRLSLVARAGSESRWRRGPPSKTARCATPSGSLPCRTSNRESGPGSFAGRRWAGW